MNMTARIADNDSEINENALAIIETKTGNSLIEAFQPNGLESLIEAYKKRAATFKGDISTKKGRDEIRSFAANIAKDKSSLEKFGKKSVEDLQKTVKAVTAERIRAVEALQEIQDGIRKPLTEWENADKKRIEDNEQSLIIIAQYGFYAVHNWQTISQEYLAKTIAAFDTEYNRDFQEFSERVKAAKSQSITEIKEALLKRTHHDAEQAELARLRKEETERKQREHEDKLKAEAAEKAKKEAEAEAKKVADAEAARVKAEQEKAGKERLRLEAEKKAATERAETAERERIAAGEKAKKDAEAAKLKAENDAKLAAEKAEKEKQAAIQAERDRAEAEKKREADETAKREANKAHRTKINNEILHDLNKVIGGIEADEAVIGKAIITAIAQNEIRHVRISY